VTVDLNGHVAVRARADGQGPSTELVLARSGFTGTPVRIHTNRNYLARAIRLGFTEVQVVGPEDPVACRDGRRHYVWQPLGRESAIGPADDAIRIESIAPVEPPVVVPAPTRSLDRDRRDAPRDGTFGCEGGQGRGHGTGVTGLAALIQEAEALHRALADAKGRTHRLVGALRRERKRSRLVASTLSALRQIRLQEAVE
jgi:hypothetical protein